MTVDRLHALYRAAHAEAWRVTQGGVLRAFEVSVNSAGLTAPERLILELALHDATNGTPARSRDGFERALRQAPELFGGLGLEPVESAAEWLDAA
jgi:hypothetical protein